MKLQTLKLPEIKKDALATQKEMREFIKRSDKRISIKLADVRIRDKFNLREDFGDLDSLANSIEEMGLQEPITVDVLKTGEAVLVDGERRYRAICILVNKSMELKQRFEYIDAQLSSNELSEADRVASMLVHNSGKPFEPLEEAEGLRRLNKDHKMTLTQIANKIGKPVPYVEQRLLLASSDDEEKSSVRTGKISATAQIELMRKEKSPEARKAVVKKAAASGKKVKVKDVKAAPIGKMCDTALELCKRADKKNKDAEVQNLLFEIDAKLREIKKAAK